MSSVVGPAGCHTMRIGVSVVSFPSKAELFDNASSALALVGCELRIVIVLTTDTWVGACTGTSGAVSKHRV